MTGTPFGLDDDPPGPSHSGSPPPAHWSEIKFGGNKVKIVGIKEGGMGKVLIGAIEGNTLQKIAVKTFDKRWFFEARVRQAFQREISVWLQLSNTPFVFSAIEVQIIGGIPHVVMPLVEPNPDGAISAGDLVRASPAGVDGERVFEIALATAMGLDAARKKIPGLIHGDIKPDNILLPGGIPHVSDFGLADILNAARTIDDPAGTPEYLAPEIWSGKPRALAGDIYAYGCTLFELLTGQPPYGRDRSEQRQAHCSGAVVSLPPFAQTTAAAHLATLSIWCLAKDPLDRPESFKIIIGQLLEIGLQHAPDTTARFIHYVVNFDEITDHVSHQIGGDKDVTLLLKEDQVASLIEVGEVDAALEVLAQTPVESRSVNMLLLTGSALSLSGNDEEALEYFNLALAKNPDADTRIRCLSEKGLSLRRLCRYDEAISLYEELARTAPDHQLRMAIFNYAGTLLDAGKLEEAEVRAQWLAQRSAGEATTWTLIGQIKRAQKKYDEAIESFTRACRLDPGMVQARFERGVLLMDHRLDLEGALADFDFTFGQNYHPKNLIVRLISVNLLLSKPEAMGLMKALEKQDKDLAMEIIRQALQLAKDLGERIAERRGATPEQATVGDKHKRSGLLKSAWANTKSLFGQRKTETQQPPSFAKSLRLEGALLLGEDGPLAKMLAYRIFVGETWAAVDYYNDMRDPKYAETFGDGIRSLFRVLQDQVPGLTIRSSPFNFIRCANCGYELLTNRGRGDRLMCRRCDKKGPVTIPQEPRNQKLIEACERAAGYRRQKLDGRWLILVIWPSPSLDRKQATERAQSLGWKQELPNDVIGRLFSDEALSRGFGKTSNDCLLLTCECSASDYVYEDGAVPWPVQEFVIELAEKFGQQLSASMVVTGDMMKVMFESPRNRIEAIQTEYGSQPSDPEVRGLLIKCLAYEDRLDEASALVPPASQWTTIAEPRLLEGRGVLAYRLGRLSEARDLLERARDLAPLDFGVRASLMNVYRDQNETDLARAEFNQIRSIGMPLLG